MGDVKLTASQEFVLRKAEADCLMDARGAWISVCERLRAKGLMCKTTFRTFKVTAAGRRWIAAKDFRL